MVLSAYKSPIYEAGQYGRQDLSVFVTILYLPSGHLSTHLKVSRLPKNAGADGQI